MYTVTPAYYDITLEGKMLRDEESVEMLDIILNTTLFELGYIWTWGGIYSTICNSVTSDDTNIASKLKATEKACNRAIQQTLDAIEDATGKQ